MVWTGPEITWSGFGGAGFQIDGTQSIDQADLISDVNMAVDMDGVSHTLVYTNHKLTGFMDFYSAGMDGDPFSVSVSGRVSIDDLGDFAVSGDLEELGVCEAEPDTGAMSLVGPFVFEMDFDGASDCDGCISWTSRNQSGEDCYEDADTGW